MQTECLISGDDPTVHVRIRFLHLLNREVGHLTSPRHDLNSGVEPEYVVIDSLEVDGRTIRTWQEAIERDVDIPALNVRNLLAHPQQHAFGFPANRELEFIADPDGDARSIIVRKQQQIDGTVEISADASPTICSSSGFSCAMTAPGTHPLESIVLQLIAGAMTRAVTRPCSERWPRAHIIMRASGGEFVSLLDPPEPLRSFAAACKNVGIWPVLAGDSARR